MLCLDPLFALKDTTTSGGVAGLGGTGNLRPARRPISSWRERRPGKRTERCGKAMWKPMWKLYVRKMDTADE